jgi:hypothetical protein
MYMSSNAWPHKRAAFDVVWFILSVQKGCKPVRSMLQATALSCAEPQHLWHSSNFRGSRWTSTCVDTLHSASGHLH